MTNLQHIAKCLDDIRHNAELLTKQPSRRRHELAREILKAHGHLRWHLSLYMREQDHAHAN